MDTHLIFDGPQNLDQIMMIHIRFLTPFFIALACMALSSCGPSDSSPPPPQPDSRIPQENASGATSSPKTQDFSAFPEPYRSADYALGRRTFKLCSACHTVAEGATNLVGPNLHGIFGREAGSHAGFHYSKALANAGFTWTPERVEEWLANPNSYLPGNNMSFTGVRKPEDRHAVIAYLMLESGYTNRDSDESVDTVP